MTAKQATRNEGQQDSAYPTLEALIERATSEEVAQVFAPVREGLAQLKGPRAEQGKKVDVALARVEELLQYLLEVRERLETEKRAGKGRK